MRLECPCGKSLKVPDHLAGKKVRCTAWGKGLLVQEEITPEEEPVKSKEAKAEPPSRTEKKVRSKPEVGGKAKGRGGSREKDKKAGFSPLLLVLCLAGVGVLGGGGVAVYLLVRPAEPKNSAPNTIAPQTQSPRPDAQAPVVKQEMTAEAFTKDLFVGASDQFFRDKYEGKICTIVGVVAIVNNDAAGLPVQIALAGCNPDSMVFWRSQPTSRAASQADHEGTEDQGTGQVPLHLASSRAFQLRDPWGGRA